MLKAACILTGDNHQLVASDTPASKKKIAAMAIAMMIPIIIWVFNGFMLAYQVLESGLLWAILTSVVCGTIVFFIEKLVIMANGNGWLSFFRVCIGFLIAGLGSIAIDEVIFKNDIDLSVATLKTHAIQQAKDDAKAEFETLNDYSKLDQSINEAKLNHNRAEKDVIDEANGTYGTGKSGAGKVTAIKDRKAKERKAELDNLLMQKAELDKVKDNYVRTEGEKRVDSFNEHALLIRIKALFRLVVSDGYMLTTYIFFTLLLFFFEFLVVILKHTWKKTNYEKKIEMIEEIGRRRMEFLQRKDSPLTDPGSFSPHFEMARTALKNSPSVFK